jgi:hypothetical protein
MISDSTKLSDLTVGEFRKLVRAMLQEAVWELEQSLPDPDAGRTLKPEIEAYLARSLEEKPDIVLLDDVKSELGFDE